MGADAEGLDAEAEGTAAELDGGGVELAHPGGHLLVTCEVSVSIGGDHIGSGAALDAQQLQVAGLGVGAGEGGVDDALLTVDDGILTVGGEAHDRDFAALFQIILHILGAGLLVAAEEHTDTAADGQAGIPEGGQGVEGGDGGALVVGGAAAPDLAVGDFSAIGSRGPALTGGDHVQMAQNCHHFLALAEFAPAHVAVDVDGLKAQGLGGVQGMVQAAADFHAIGGAGFGGAFHTGDAQIFAEAIDHLVLSGENSFIQSHIEKSFQRS